MKRAILSLLFLSFVVANDSFSQVSNTKKAVTHQSIGTTSSTIDSTSTITAVIMPGDTTANEAYGNSSGRFSIADPVINTLNQRAAGSNLTTGRSGIIGMPRNAYGFANGKLWLRPTTATSSGTIYGSGSVATGTTIMGIGTGENTPGINGKNPYAGPSLWGIKPPPAQAAPAPAKKH